MSKTIYGQEYPENTYLDRGGLKHLLQLIYSKFVPRKEGMGLSSNDYTTEEKEKLAAISEFELPNASSDVLGGIKVGSGLKIDENGVLHTTGGGGVADYIEWENIIDKPDLPDEASDIGAVDISVLGQPNGVATLNKNGVVDESQLPFISSIEEGYLNNDGVFCYEFNGEVIEKSSNTLYIDTHTELTYRWNGENFIQITSADITTITNEEIDEIIGGE